MAEPDGGGISARLWRLPGQLLLALAGQGKHSSF
jgi:hypothetical protein